jgi:hypothetical protein
MSSLLRAGCGGGGGGGEFNFEAGDADDAPILRWLLPLLLPVFPYFIMVAVSDMDRYIIE